MSIYVRHAMACAVVIGMIIVGFWVLSYSRSVHSRHQAERLLQRLASLQQNGMTSAAVKRLAKDSAGREDCTGDSCKYNFDYGFAFPTSTALRLLARTEWDYVGLRPWTMSAEIQTKNGEVTNLVVRAVVGRGRGWLYNQGLFAGNMWASLMVDVLSSQDQFDWAVRQEKEYANARALGTGNRIEVGTNGILVGKPNVDTPGSGEGLIVDLSPTAPPEVRKIAFDIQLHCATAISPCTNLCQLAPSAWHSYAQYQKVERMVAGPSL
jgi:hypothetical protein